MTEEEARQLREAYEKHEEEVIQKDRRIEDLEGRLMSAFLCIEELERQLGTLAVFEGTPFPIAREPGT